MLPRIRPAVLEDVPRIAQVHVSAWQAAYRGIVPSEYLDALSVTSRALAWRECLVRGSPEVLVAEVSGATVGWVAFGASRDADGGEGTGEVEAIYALPSYWSVGVGRALWSAAQGRLVERGFRRVTLWVLADNERAARFYRAAGFRLLLEPPKTITIGSRALLEVRYERSLG